MAKDYWKQPAAEKLKIRDGLDTGSPVIRLSGASVAHFTLWLRCPLWFLPPTAHFFLPQKCGSVGLFQLKMT